MKVKDFMYIGLMMVIASGFYFTLGCDPAVPVPTAPLFDNTKMDLISPTSEDTISSGGSFTWDEPEDADCVLGVFYTGASPTVTDGVLDTTYLVAGSRTGLPLFGNGSVGLNNLYEFDVDDFDSSTPATIAGGMNNGIHYWAVWCFKNAILTYSSPAWQVTVTWP